MSCLNFSCNIEGVDVFKLKQFANDKGDVLHMLRSDAEDFTTFGESYFSEVLPKSVKAWKKHSIQTQNIAVPIGRIRMILYDDRDTSHTKGQLQEIILGRPDSYYRVRIAPQIWYGFACLGDTAALLANCVDVPHDPSESEVLSIDSFKIPFQWLD